MEKGMNIFEIDNLNNDMSERLDLKEDVDELTEIAELYTLSERQHLQVQCIYEALKAMKDDNSLSASKAFEIGVKRVI